MVMDESWAPDSCLFWKDNREWCRNVLCVSCNEVAFWKLRPALGRDRIRQPPEFPNTSSWRNNKCGQTIEFQGNIYHLGWHRQLPGPGMRTELEDRGQAASGREAAIKMLQISFMIHSAVTGKSISWPSTAQVTEKGVGTECLLRSAKR